LDRLFDQLQQQPPWPAGRIDEETQPELIRAIREACRELWPDRGQEGEE
jgi:hypothetical protein